jgi:hypothetical protein
MKRVLVVGAVALLVLSGCSALSGPAEFAPGVTDERVVNATALSAAHAAVLANGSYTFTRNASQRVEADGYRYAVDHDTRVWVSTGGDYLYRHRAVVDTMEGSSHRVDGVWSNGSVAVTRTVDVDNESVRYTRYRPPEPYSVADVTRSGISSALGAATVVETWNHSGARYARLASNESETRRIQARNRTAVNATTTREAAATVRADGFVPRMARTITGQRPLPSSVDANAAVGHINDTTTIRYTDVGSTVVGRPDWVDDALEATEDLAPGEHTQRRPA